MFHNGKVSSLVVWSLSITKAAKINTVGGKNQRAYKSNIQIQNKGKKNTPKKHWREKLKIKANTQASPVAQW